MNVIYADPEGFHEELLGFTTLSDATGSIDGVEYSVSHTQWANFDVRHLVELLAEHTSTDPRHDDEFADAAQDVALEHFNRCFEATDNRRNHFNNREFFSTSDLDSAARNYHIDWISHEQDGDGPYDAVNLTAETRIQGIADVISMLNAKRAALDAYRDVSERYGTAGHDDDDYHKPDEDADLTTVPVALRQIAFSVHGPSALQQPNPTFELSNAMYQVFDEIGMSPDVRQAYGIIIDPSPPMQYDPQDAFGREMSASLGNLTASMMGMPTNGSEKWTSPDEPPLKSLDSYKEHHQ